MSVEHKVANPSNTGRVGVVGSFVAYLERVLADDPDGSVALLGVNDNVLPKDANVAVVIGSRSRWWLRRARRRTGLSPRFSGIAQSDESGQGTRFTILDRWDPTSVAPVPDSYDVLAVVTTYNEAEIVGDLIDQLRSGGVRVHVIDNWSTDDTLEVVRSKAQDNGVTFERFPSEAPPAYFELEELLTRVEEVAHASKADWVVHHDCDEFRAAPWLNVPLRQALWMVDSWGFNCVDHTIVNFRPVDNSWRRGDSLRDSFGYFEFGDAPAHFIQLKTWKPQPERVVMANTGGHIASFQGRRVFPYKFVTLHYPIRSQEHGERKILRERQQRWSPSERSKGWHTHYDHYDQSTSFTWDPRTLLQWDQIDQQQLLQRLSGAGLEGNPEALERPS